MTLTASQVRIARELLGWTPLVFCRRVPIGLDKVNKAQDDQGIAALSGLDLRAIRMAFERSGIEFRADGAVRVRGMP